MLGNFTASTNRLSTTICLFLNSHNMIQQRTEKKTFSLGRLDVSLSVSGYEIFAHIVCNMILAWQRTINNFRFKNYFAIIIHCMRVEWMFMYVQCMYVRMRYALLSLCVDGEDKSKSLRTRAINAFD